MAGDAGHNTCTTDAADSNVNDHISAQKGPVLSINSIRRLSYIVVAWALVCGDGGPATTANTVASSIAVVSAELCGPSASRRPPPRFRRPPRPSEACWKGSCSISPGHQPPIRGNGG